MKKRRFEEKVRTRNRQPGTTIVIVCEGKKTEKLYFKGFKERESNVRIEIPNSDKYTDPKNLVRHAALMKQKFGVQNDGKSGVWVVFDVDGNSDQTLQQARDQAVSRDITTILSNPSFEIWYLLHFAYTARSFTNKDLLNELRKQKGLSAYEKSDEAVFQTILPEQPKAVQHAERLLTHHRDLKNELYSSRSNPSTEVHLLVSHIENAKQAP